MIYLDNHATTRLDPRVLEAMLPWLTDRYGNAGSGTHEMGREARDAVEGARQTFAAVIGAEPREIIFTSGATESNNLALLGTARRHDGGRCVTLATEHPAVLEPLEHLGRCGDGRWDVVRLAVRSQADAEPGRVRLEDLEAAVTPGTMLVSIMVANNEIGVLQDLAAIASIAHEAGALLHVDSAQAIGRLPVQVDAIGADLVSFSAHKFHGPKGAGVLYVRRRGRAVRLEPLQFGGGQERGLRGGTLDVPAVVGLAEAARLAEAERPEDQPRMRRLRDRLWEGLAGRLDGLAINGPPLDSAVRLDNNLNLRVAGVEGGTLLAELSRFGLAASAGSACASEQPRPSHVLTALGLDPEAARSSLRFGLSKFTTAAEIDTAVECVAEAVRRLRGMGYPQ